MIPVTKETFESEVLFKGGEEADRSVGLVPRDAILKLIGG